MVVIAPTLPEPTAVLWRVAGCYDRSMPELPEVETIVAGLSRRLTGQTIDGVYLTRGDVVHGVPVPLCAALHGRRVVGVSRVGKYLRLDTDGTLGLRIHLGMSGRLTVVDRGEPVAVHTHLRLTFRRSRSELRFCDPRRFGGIWLVNGNESTAGDWLGRRLPPAGVDPLVVDAATFTRLMNRSRQIKAALLDQRILGGVGNIYCDEALHRARIHPLTPASRLTTNDVRRLHDALRRVLTEAIRAGGSSISDYRTADGASGSFQHKHRVYARAGQPCRRCRTLIIRTTVAGRGTFLCPACQRLPANSAPVRRDKRQRQERLGD
ncbi:MAG: bifunctional DNA-formamidopyrimidine glycosylase/DNA-(apurinic or apyrimidinic site) lyase [Phycisphaerae bacterium]|nr:bifunctional DNA-formamidopyrimidine glycosylase/DNA-(apurinic or apyrimidinic site) lyase [Phycisphaerae bacterium]